MDMLRCAKDHLANSLARMLAYLITWGPFNGALACRTLDMRFPAIESIAIRMDPAFIMLLRCSVHPALLQKQDTPRCSFFAIESHSMMTLYGYGLRPTRSVPSAEQKP